jgi:hypothetical protein
MTSATGMGMSALLVCLLLLAPTIFYLACHHFPGAHSSRTRFRVGSLIVYQTEKAAPHPEAEAFDIHPSQRGELYYYSVADYVRVIDQLADGKIIGVGRDNIRHQFSPDDKHLRRATWTERFLLRPRLPRP